MDFYETCTFISVETSNNQQACEQMPFYIFNNYTKFLTNILEKKNKAENGENGSTDVNEMKNNMFSQSKAQLKSFVPKSSTNFKKF